ncbi:Neutral protease 2 [Pleurostoma richardsiae]|uniref:Neutral protease 2 n=1 Tax=Pleurostoma richardsiae TaxID=41990 RepID=A0AA38VKW3_9PEZI|nr:Neutral protease 2 [Pleurostoma richardsiae]
MKFFARITLLAAAACAVSVDLEKRETPLDVKLELIGNSNVKASITNTGSSGLKIFKTGTILDAAAVEKVDVFSGADKVEFDGLRLTVSTEGLNEESFQTIAAGETVEVEWDVAEVHDLSSGGDFDLALKSAVSYAEEGSTEIAGVIPISSNTLTATVDGAAAAQVRRDFHEKAKRQIVQSDCTGTRRTATVNAISACRSLALAASSAAASGSASKMTEYYKSSSTTTRNTVASVFSRVASECGSSSSGVSRYYCSDVYGACSSGVLAYTLPSQSYMVNCNLYFTGLTALSRTCHAQDQATTTLHEVTHLTQIKGTSDYGVYGYNAVRGLSAAQNLNHADTYSLFANAIYVGC